MITPTTGVGHGRASGWQTGRQVRGRRGRVPPERGQVVAERGHVPDLAAGPRLLAVQVDLERRATGRRGGAAARRAPGRSARPAEHVRHRHRRRGQPGLAERVVEHRPQVLLELRRPGALDGPVAGVVRAHRQLVDQQLAVGPLEQLDGQHADDVQLAGEPQRDLARPARATSAGRPGAGASTSTQMPSRWTVSHHRVRRDLPERRARHQRGQLPAQRHPLLDHQRHAGGQQRAGLGRGRDAARRRARRSRRGPP